MADKSKKKLPSKDRLKRYQLAAIPMLLFVLGYVLFAPGGDDTTPSPKSNDSASVAADIRSPNINHDSAEPSALHEPQAWPEADLDFLRSPNPFFTEPPKPAIEHLVSAPPTTTRSGDNSADDSNEDSPPASNAAKDSLAALTDTLSQQPVNYIFESKQRKMVMLGQHLLEKGEPLSEGLQVHEIRDGALLVSTRNLPSPQADARSTPGESKAAWQTRGSAQTLPTWQDVRDFLMIRTDQSNDR